MILLPAKLDCTTELPVFTSWIVKDNITKQASVQPHKHALFKSRPREGRPPTRSTSLLSRNCPAPLSNDDNLNTSAYQQNEGQQGN